MTDSLVVNNLVELMAGGVRSSDPRCPGVVFSLMPGYSFGSPVPDMSIITSMSGDGERPFGDRASDRTHSVPVGISAADRQALIAAREVLVAMVNKPAWPLTVRKPGLPDTVYDCFRATTSQPDYDVRYEKMNVGTVTLTFAALPYARSFTYESLAFAASPSPVVLDDYSTVSGTNWSQEVLV